MHPATVAVAEAGVKLPTSVNPEPLVTASGPEKAATAGCNTVTLANFVADWPAAFVTDIVTVVVTVGLVVRCAVNGPVSAPESIDTGGLNVIVQPAQP